MNNRCFFASTVWLFCCVILTHGEDLPPSFSLTQQQRDDLATPVIDALRGIQQQGGTALINKLQDASLGDLDKPESGEPSDATSGKSLSRCFFGNARPFESDNILDATNLVKTNEEYKTSIFLYASIEQLSYQQNSSLIQWLASRSTAVPATRCDKIILASLPTDFHGFSESFWDASRGFWKLLLTAKNPIYRLIALRNVRSFEPDISLVLLAYKNGLNEYNTLLQNAAFEGLKSIGTAQARELLQSFLNLGKLANDGTMPDAFDINAAVLEYLNPTQ